MTLFSRLLAFSGSAAGPAAQPVAPAVPPVPARALPRQRPAETRAERALLDALTESRQRFKDIVDVSGDFAWEVDADGVFVFVSPGAKMGYRSGDLVGQPAHRFVADDGAGRKQAAQEAPFSARAPVRDKDVWLTTAAGRIACLQTSAVPVLGKDGAWLGARGICRDVTEERRQHADFVSLQVREALMARIVKAAASELDPEAMLATALHETRNALSADRVDLRRPDAASAAAGAFRLTAFSAAASPLDADDGDAAEPPVLTTILARMAESRSMVTAADGDRFYLCAPAVFRGEVTGAILVARALAAGAWTDTERSFSDELAGQFAVMLEQIDSHRKLEALARNDELTGLLNRRAYFDDLGDRLARVQGGGSGGAMFYIDFDNFKLVNDVHGHKRGDEALIALADLLTAKTRPGDLVARLGGDEMAMWLERTDEVAARGRAEGLIDAARGLRIFSGSPDRPLGISLGIAVVETGSRESLADISARADAAMYRVKKNGKSGFVIADAAPEVACAPDRGTEDRPDERASA